MKTAYVGVFASVAALVAGCTFPSSKPMVSRNQVGHVQRLEYGTIQKMTPVTIGGHGSPIGVMGGGLTGAAAGSGVGHGAGRDLARAGGAVVGAITGQAIEEVVTREEGLEFMIKLDSGSIIMVTQASPPTFNVGDRVAVATGGGAARVMLP